MSAFARSGHSNDQKEAESKGCFRPKGVIHNWPPSKPRFPDQFRQPLINQHGLYVEFGEHANIESELHAHIRLSLLVELTRYGVFGMVTWRQRFESLSAVEREEIDKWKGGASNIPTLRQALEAVSEFLRQYEQAGLPDRDQV